METIKSIKYTPSTTKINSLNNANLPDLEITPLIDPLNISSKPIETLDLNNLNPYYSKDESGNVSLKTIHPKLQNKIKELQEKCEKEGIPIKIKDTVRTMERQNELYSKGRTTEGSIVTNANGSNYSSNHQWGIAFDFCIADKSDPYNIDKINKVGEIGKSIGLEWAGDWKNFKEKVHFQLKEYDDLKEIYSDPSEFVDDNWGETLQTIKEIMTLNNQLLEERKKFGITYPTYNQSNTQAK